MAILIKRQKIKNENNIGYYKVFTQDFGGANFYIGINKNKKIIKLYQNHDFSKPIRIINYSNPEEKIGTFLNVNPGILGRVIMQAIKIFSLDTFPENLDYAA